MASVTLWNVPDLSHLRPIRLVRNHVRRSLLWAEVPVGLCLRHIHSVLFGADNLGFVNFVYNIIHCGVRSEAFIYRTIPQLPALRYTLEVPPNRRRCKAAGWSIADC